MTNKKSLKTGLIVSTMLAPTILGLSLGLKSLNKEITPLTYGYENSYYEAKSTLAYLRSPENENIEGRETLISSLEKFVAERKPTIEKQKKESDVIVYTSLAYIGGGFALSMILGLIPMIYSKIDRKINNWIEENN